MINAYLDTQYEPSITLDNILVDPVKPITIPLLPELTIVENAQHYYKQYTKLKNRMQSGLYQLNQSTQRINYLQSVLYSLTIADSKELVQEIYTECEQAGLLKKSKNRLVINRQSTTSCTTSLMVVKFSLAVIINKMSI